MSRLLRWVDRHLRKWWYEEHFGHLRARREVPEKTHDLETVLRDAEHRLRGR